MSFYPKVSVVIRTCDRFGLLKRALNSVIKQSYDNLEIIIVDDGTCKINAECLQQYQQHCPVKLVFPESKGRSSAANKGIRVATGSFICFLDDDDEYLPQHIRALVNRSLTADGLVYSNALHSFERYVEATDQLECLSRRKVLYNEFDKEFLLFSNYIPLHTVLFPKHVFAEHRFDEDISLFEDWDLLIRLSQHYSFTHLDEFSCIYRVWSNTQISQSTDRNIHLQAYQHLSEKHFKKLSPAVITTWWEKVDRETQLLKEELVNLKNHYESEERKQSQSFRIECAAATSRNQQLSETLAQKQQMLTLYIQENENKETMIINLQQQLAGLQQRQNLLLRLRQGLVSILHKLLPPPVFRMLVRFKQRLWVR